MIKKLNYKIDIKILDELHSYRDKLPVISPGSNGMRYPAGIALLGMKNKLVDRSSYLTMTGGCWDTPAINYKNMDVGFRRLIEEDREIVGMALIRNKLWNDSSEKDKIPKDLRRNIHDFKNTFADITKTIWLIISDKYFRVYRVKKSKNSRITIYESKTKKLYTKGNSELFTKKREEETYRRKIREAQKIAKEEKTKEEAEKERKQIEETKKREEAQRKKEIKKKERIDKSLKEGKNSIISLGNGYCYMKDKNGIYILWQIR